MTTTELIKELQKYPADTKIAIWNGDDGGLHKILYVDNNHVTKGMIFIDIGKDIIS